MAQNQQQITDRLPLRAGAVAGAASFVGGYLITMAMVALSETGELTSDLIQASGWLYYNAQLADVELSVTSTGDSSGFGALFDGITFNYVTDGSVFGESFSLQLPSVLYHLVPILCLGIAGFALARYVGSHTTQDGAIAGATILAGTLPLSLLGTFLFTLEEDGTAIAPALTESILFVGIFFPLFFGALGGALSSRL